MELMEGCGCLWDEGWGKGTQTEKQLLSNSRVPLKCRANEMKSIEMAHVSSNAIDGRVGESIIHFFFCLSL